MKKYLYTILITFLMLVIEIKTINSELLGVAMLFGGIVTIGCFIVIDLATWVENREISETEKYLGEKTTLDLEIEALQNRYEKLTEQIEKSIKKKKKKKGA